MPHESPRERLAAAIVRAHNKLTMCNEYAHGMALADAILEAVRAEQPDPPSGGNLANDPEFGAWREGVWAKSIRELQQGVERLTSERDAAREERDRLKAELDTMRRMRDEAETSLRSARARGDRLHDELTLARAVVEEARDVAKYLVDEHSRGQFCAGCMVDAAHAKWREAIAAYDRHTKASAPSSADSDAPHESSNRRTPGPPGLATQEPGDTGANPDRGGTGETSPGTAGAIPVSGAHTYGPCSCGAWHGEDSDQLDYELVAKASAPRTGFARAIGAVADSLPTSAVQYPMPAYEVTPMKTSAPLEVSVDAAHRETAGERPSGQSTAGSPQPSGAGGFTCLRCGERPAVEARAKLCYRCQAVHVAAISDDASRRKEAEPSGAIAEGAEEPFEGHDKIDALGTAWSIHERALPLAELIERIGTELNYAGYPHTVDTGGETTSDMADAVRTLRLEKDSLESRLRETTEKLRGAEEAFGRMRTVLGLIAAATPEQIAQHAEDCHADMLENHQAKIDEWVRAEAATKERDQAVARVGNLTGEIHRAIARLTAGDPVLAKLGLREALGKAV